MHESSQPCKSNKICNCVNKPSMKYVNSFPVLQLCKQNLAWNMCKPNKICGRKVRNYLCYKLTSCHACNVYATLYNKRYDLLNGSVYAHMNNSVTTILDIGYYSDLSWYYFDVLLYKKQWENMEWLNKRGLFLYLWNGNCCQRAIRFGLTTTSEAMLGYDMEFCKSNRRSFI